MADIIRFLAGLPQRYCLAMALAALLSVAPFILPHTASDTDIYLIWMRCFTEQFWQGDLYPRWCMDVNDGQGMPVFLFYFPLPFYIAALFQPLTYLGISYYGLFVFLCFLASLLAGLACFAWLKDIVAPARALLASIFYLFMPYHLEMLSVRSSYSELWVYALLPLLFKYTRRLARQDAHVFMPLVVLIALLLLTHVPVTAGALLIAALYIAMTSRAWQPLFSFLLAALWALALAAFYIVPCLYYRRFLPISELVHGATGWANGFLQLEFLHTPGLNRPFYAALLGSGFLALIGTSILLQRHRIVDAFIRREAMAWLALGLLALLLLLPVSAPLYALPGPFAKVLFPWRMQNFMTLGMVYLLAVWMQWIAGAPSVRLKAACAAALAALAAFNFVLIVPFSAHDTQVVEQVIAAKINYNHEYRTEWTDTRHWHYQSILQQMAQHLPRARIFSGSGVVTVAAWRWSGIELHIHAATPVKVRLNHYYFPVWQAALDGDTPLPLRPDNGSGQMLLDVPAGNHRVTLTYGVANGASYLAFSQWLSLAALIALCGKCRPCGYGYGTSG